MLTLQGQSCLEPPRLVARTKLFRSTLSWLRGQSCPEALRVGCGNKVVSSSSVGGYRDEVVFSRPVPSHPELVVVFSHLGLVATEMTLSRATQCWSRD
jgi:hypothetical protein